MLSVIAILAIASIFVIVLGAGGSDDAPLSSFSRIERFINSNKHTQPEDYAPAELIPDIPPGAEAIATALGTVYPVSYTHLEHASAGDILSRKTR